LPQLLSSAAKDSFSKAMGALALLWSSAGLVGFGQGTRWSIAGLVIAAVAAFSLRQLNRWDQGLTAGNGQAPRNR